MRIKEHLANLLLSLASVLLFLLVFEAGLRIHGHHEDRRDEVVLVIQATRPETGHIPDGGTSLARVEADARIRLVDERREPRRCPCSLHYGSTGRPGRGNRTSS